MKYLFWGFFCIPILMSDGFAASKTGCAAKLIEWEKQRNASDVVKGISRLTGTRPFYVFVVDWHFGDFTTPVQTYGARGSLGPPVKALSDYEKLKSFFEQNGFRYSDAETFMPSRVTLRILRVTAPKGDFEKKWQSFKDVVSENKSIFYIGAKKPQLMGNRGILYAEPPSDFEGFANKDFLPWNQLRDDEVLIGKVLLTRPTESELKRVRDEFAKFGFETPEITGKDIPPHPPSYRNAADSAWLKIRGTKALFERATLVLNGFASIGYLKSE